MKFYLGVIVLLGYFIKEVPGKQHYYDNYHNDFKDPVSQKPSDYSEDDYLYDYNYDYPDHYSQDPYSYDNFYTPSHASRSAMRGAKSYQPMQSKYQSTQPSYQPMPAISHPVQTGTVQSRYQPMPTVTPQSRYQQPMQQTYQPMQSSYQPVSMKPSYQPVSMQPRYQSMQPRYQSMQSSYDPTLRSGYQPMNSYNAKPRPRKVFVPVVIKKRNKKKTKIISVSSGFYVPGGTMAFGKFKDLHSCKKACELTGTCFGGDFNRWLGKCFFHSNVSACTAMRTHSAIVHFTKVPCTLLETPRAFVALGVSVLFGIEIKGVKTLQSCIKRCATAGGGIAATDAAIPTTPQICCHLDYDFATHKCYFHPCTSEANANTNFCPDGATTIRDPPLNSVANPTTVSITLCPRAP